MPRRRMPKTTPLIPDSKYGSDVVAKFINSIMRNGKKSLAIRMVYEVLEAVESKYNKTMDAEKPQKESGSSAESQGPRLSEDKALRTVEIFKRVVAIVCPKVEVRSRRVGGATYQVPVDVSLNRGIALTFRWLIQYAKQRKEKGMIQKLIAEMLDILNGRGATIKKRDDTLKMAMANKAFAHYAR